MPITRVVIPSISLDTKAVLAHLVEGEHGVTWEVPAFVAGHAAYTAGAGQPGNGVLIGHVSSLRGGNVFQELDKVKVGDIVQVYHETREFAYRVVEVRSVSRTDISVLQPTESSTVTLITCTGVWLPTVWDYSERLVVRGELIDPLSSTLAPSP